MAEEALNEFLAYCPDEDRGAELTGGGYGEDPDDDGAALDYPGDDHHESWDELDGLAEFDQHSPDDW